MTAPSRAHRASAQRRRAALLDAAAELAAEVGAGAVTHRAVAARAGVPLSTTSYFFGSIDELVTEALRRGAQSSISDFDDAERRWVLNEDEPVDVAIDHVIDRVLENTSTAEGSQVELYLAAGRQEDLRADVATVVERFAARIDWQLARRGAPQSTDAGWAMQAFQDGAMLHRLAGVGADDRARLAAGMRLLLASSMLTDDELADLLARFDRAAADQDDAVEAEAS
ncbi:TetR family transcriptional regulator [Aquihabitans sp. G128]|uniref:TetR/AcrR family transcriptional regulator n=1 Tax=Aquihabitans sp. G128 TaxID=2849779 RepID=UPI001C21EDB4|nr:TetR family transcriptional regulator [Aquihabitans sp. G128]QXC59577.1 TetR family transcriptional regulator [Aquihabitans sp. G128]